MATYYAVTNKTGSHIQVNELNGQLEIYENEALAKAEIKDGFKITKIEVTKSDSESENPLAKREYKICYVEGGLKYMCGKADSIEEAEKLREDRAKTFAPLEVLILEKETVCREIRYTAKESQDSEGEIRGDFIR